MNNTDFNTLCAIWIFIAVAAFILLQFVTAPYGRHTKKGWGIEISNQWGWIIMELPSFLIMLYFSLVSNQNTYTLILFALWLIHYFNRTFVFPLRIKTKGKKMPLVIAISAIFFNAVNASLNGYYLSYLSGNNSSSVESINFILGISFFAVGFFINQKSDHYLISLRKPGERGYKIPIGWLFKYISCPNHFGEIIQWTGFALMAYNYAALSFLIWTLANLVPRAIKHHRWYKEKFPEYPPNRKALIPWLI
ncbi:DUF1295 domain-containing protein [Reichenbachiella sp.]|uniref:DUF1295 domain-containing protein n=1 Tax=Reichenbachiella sp. TaxID=2184521 RepID=UPI003B5A3F9B